MSDGLMLPPGQGRTLGAGITLKVSAEQAASASSFEIIVPPGYDVGAHVHARQEELFYILEGELDLFAFEPVTRTDENWRIWQSRTGAQVFRGGPGSLMFVPPGCPHALQTGNGFSPYALPGCPSRLLGVFRRTFSNPEERWAA